jgi:hypothetical protein
MMYGPSIVVVREASDGRVEEPKRLSWPLERGRLAFEKATEDAGPGLCRTGGPSFNCHNLILIAIVTRGIPNYCYYPSSLPMSARG